MGTARDAARAAQVQRGSGKLEPLGARAGVPWHLYWERHDNSTSTAASFSHCHLWACGLPLRSLRPFVAACPWTTALAKGHLVAKVLLWIHKRPQWTLFSYVYTLNAMLEPGSTHWKVESMEKSVPSIEPASKGEKSCTWLHTLLLSPAVGLQGYVREIFFICVGSKHGTGSWF